MELKKLLTLKTGMSIVKLVAVIAIMASAVISVVAIYYGYNAYKNAGNVIYIMDRSGAVTTAKKVPQSMHTRKYEYYDHVKKFYKLWYAFDENSYKNNIERALHLTGETGKELYNSYKEQGIYRRLMEKSLILYVDIEEIKVNVNSDPVVGYVKGIQTVKRLKGQISRRMDCTFELYDVDRDSLNSHGVLIEKWEVVNNEIIEK